MKCQYYHRWAKGRRRRENEPNGPSKGENMLETGPMCTYVYVSGKFAEVVASVPTSFSFVSYWLSLSTSSLKPPLYRRCGGRSALYVWGGKEGGWYGDGSKEKDHYVVDIAQALPLTVKPPGSHRIEGRMERGKRRLSGAILRLHREFWFCIRGYTLHILLFGTYTTLSAIVYCSTT